MVRYIGKLGTVAVGLTTTTRLDFGQLSFHLASNTKIYATKALQNHISPSEKQEPNHPIYTRITLL